VLDRLLDKDNQIRESSFVYGWKKPCGVDADRPVQRRNSMSDGLKGVARSANGGRASRRVSLIPHPPIDRRAKVAIAVSALVAGIVLASIAGATRASAASAGGAATAGQLVIASTYHPPVHDPGAVYSEVIDLSYDTLIYQDATGKLVPQLATSWRYVGKARRTFELKLRSGVRFSDGSRLTAQVVKDSLLYSQTAKGSWAPLANFDSVTATGPLTVVLHLKTANPLIPRLLAQYYLIGTPICRAFLQDPEKLKTGTCGTGPYMLDPANTVPGDHYALKPNPYYRNKAAVHYQRIISRVISNPTSLLQAVRTGQVDLAHGDGSTFAAARSAGLQVLSIPSAFTGIQFQDVNGTLVKALGDIRVRQALNYAIDRAAITKAAFPTPGLAAVTDQPFLPIAETWSNDPKYKNKYPYDPTKAKALLKAAGYENGFTIEIVSTPLESLDVVAQAIGSYWEKVGVTLKLKSNAQPQDYGRDLNSGKYPGYAILWGGAPALIDWYAIFQQNAASGRWATFKPSDPQLNSLAKQAIRSPEAEAAKLWQQFGKRLIDLAWFVPVAMRSTTYYARSTVIVPKLTDPPPYMTIRDVRPSGK
jgi:peptide/nickel transport system substrate-binding protein